SGILTSRHFNMVLERSDFTEETAMNWLVWGAQACLGPVVMALIGGMFAALVTVCRHIAINMSATANRLDLGARTRWRRRAQTGELDNVAVLASFVLLASGIAFLWMWWSYFPLFVALATPVS